jgi:hypothetical protein
MKSALTIYSSWDLDLDAYIHAREGIEAAGVGRDT